jgi:hypothetical protein
LVSFWKKIVKFTEILRLKEEEEEEDSHPKSCSFDIDGSNWKNDINFNKGECLKFGNFNLGNIKKKCKNQIFWVI